MGYSLNPAAEVHSMPEFDAGRDTDTDIEPGAVPGSGPRDRERAIETPLRKRPFLVPAVLGVAALVLVFFSVPLIWANKTILDTEGFVSTLGNIAEKPEFKEAFSKGAKESIESSMKSQLDEYDAMLPGLGDMMRKRIKPELDKSFTKALESSQFGQAWRDSLRATHERLDARLKASGGTVGDGEVEIVLTPLVKYLTESFYEQLGDESYSFDPEAADNSVIYAKIPQMLTMFRTVTGFNFIAILGLAVAVVLMAAAVILSQKPTLTITILGAAVIVVAGSWYISSFIIERLLAEGVVSEWGSMLVPEVASVFTANFHAWAASAAFLGIALVIVGVITTFIKRSARQLK